MKELVSWFIGSTFC